jgi:hypothetical protein
MYKRPIAGLYTLLFNNNNNNNNNNRFKCKLQAMVEQYTQGNRTSIHQKGQVHQRHLESAMES